MKNNKVKELINKPAEELKKLLKDDQEKLWQLKIDLASGKIKNVKEIRQTRRNIARILTLLRELESRK